MRSIEIVTSQALVVLSLDWKMPGRIRTLPAMDVPMLKRMNYTLHIHNYVGQCDVSKLNKLLDGVAVAIQRQKEKVGHVSVFVPAHSLARSAHCRWR